MSQPLFSLGDLYVSDFLKPDEQPSHPPVELKLVMDDDGAVHLEKQPPAETMWGKKYWYRSNVTQTMSRQLKDVVDSVLQVYTPKHGDVWLDVAANTGELLKYAPGVMTKVGIDPAPDNIFNECKRVADEAIQDYFSAEVFKSRFGNTKVTVLTIISMFYDLVDPDSFLKDMYEIMEDDGIAVIQMSYTPLMLEQLEFSNILHEHYYYWSLFNFKALVERNGFKITDVTLNNTNSGSFRVFLMKDGGNTQKYYTIPDQEVCHFRIKSLLMLEADLGMERPETWERFYKRVQLRKEATTEFIRKQVASGKTVYGYGASSKGNTLLQYFGLDHTLVTAIAERSPEKYGLRTVGTNIPIVSEQEARDASPDYMLILPVHFLREFMDREREYLQRGGAFIVPYPDFCIITKDDL